MKRTFDDITAPLALDLRVAAGRIAVAAEDTTQLEVELEPLNDAAEEVLEAVVIDLRDRDHGRELLVDVPERRGLRMFGRGPEFDLRVTCPERPAVRARSSSADFEARGPLGSLELKTASGDAEAEWIAGDVEMQTASGDVELGTAVGPTRVQTASGDVAIGRAERAVRAHLVSGDLTVRDARDSVEGQTVSGDQRLECVAAGSITLQSVSGDIRVGVRKGTNVWMDVRSLSGDTSSELTPSADAPSPDDAPVVELRIRSVSGDVQIESAAGAPHSA
jgi:Putative adhesin